MIPSVAPQAFRQTASRKAVLMFPGQGSQELGMGKSLWEKSSIAAEIFSRATEVLGWSVEALCADGPQDRLTRTELLQPALFVLSVAIFETYLDAGGPVPLFAMGHSLGEYAALVAARAMSFESGLRVVAQRGLLMASSVPEGTGGMAAVIGMDEQDVERVCLEVRSSLPEGQVLGLANLNCPGQVVISGHLDSLEAANKPMRNAGAKGLIPLKVSAPFHCELMKPAAKGLFEVLEDVEISEPAFAVLSNVTGKPHEDPRSLKSLLVQQLVKPVRWTDCVQHALDSGADVFLEMGPGRVLSGLLRRIEPAAKAICVADSDGIEAVFKHFRGESQ